jgi:hypothetical protein
MENQLVNFLGSQSAQAQLKQYIAINIQQNNHTYKVEEVVSPRKQNNSPC